jgi:hypothetical protein
VVSRGKKKFKITNWKAYNKALINRDSLTFWLDELAMVMIRAVNNMTRQGCQKVCGLPE